MSNSTNAKLNSLNTTLNSSSMMSNGSNTASSGSTPMSSGSRLLNESGVENGNIYSSVNKKNSYGSNPGIFMFIFMCHFDLLNGIIMYKAIFLAICFSPEYDPPAMPM